MGYYSDAVLAVHPKKLFEFSVALAGACLEHHVELEQVEDMLNRAKTPEYPDEVDYVCPIYYHWESVKWYLSHSTVGALMTALETLNSDVFAFIRLGEDPEDYESLGNTHDFGIEISRSIEYFDSSLE